MVTAAVNSPALEPTRRRTAVGAVQADIPAVVSAGAPTPRHARREPADEAEVPGLEPMTLVVGFDNSTPARRALTWGADLLRSRRGTLARDLRRPPAA
jgi:hypothetical protein